MLEYILLTKDVIGDTYALGKDKLGGKLSAYAILNEDGSYKAYSKYFRSEYDDVVGYAESSILEHALALAIIDLGMEWLKFKEEGII
ncbi:MAG TPA: hypothetical protein VKZ77_00770 [Bacillaceae bacterium]|nr:hypothetical protein [Paenibacillus bovis]HLU20996.1 hypothetical protein [Bacillaceae bacterium]